MIIRLLAFALLWSAPAVAEESVYSPVPCEFSITFPEAPYETKRCDDDNPDNCYTQTSFTRVFDVKTTLNFRVLCSPVGAETLTYYDEKVMLKTLDAMTKRSSVSTYKTSFNNEDNFRQAGLIGEGRTGRSPVLYIAQLWAGERSLFSIEAEMIGESTNAADEMLENVLKSAKVKTEKAEELIEE